MKLEKRKKERRDDGWMMSSEIECVITVRTKPVGKQVKKVAVVVVVVVVV
ncbi:hypothetical protein G210_2389 [Candida maltosa Xu316]|uniref:Uncharacterized protein n=1 Tax=Candida maltosa (strain Xu316) TaxID=1245528 RepID=M3JFS4_CANMX|nr:hypothetical protein G210_2389 [Candida maltosa Xu316]